MARKYSVTYASGATGFEYFVDEIRHEYTACLRVWDNELEDFIFWKDCLSSKCKIDMLHAYGRDLRTTTRKAL